MLELGANTYQGRPPMRFGINLRGDLAKLTDAEIASMFETLISRREETYRAAPIQAGNKWLYQRGLGMPLGRGPLHAPIFYKFLGLRYLNIFGSSSLYDLYLLDCELKDVRDEIERRVRRQKTAIAAS
jgi:hypothetical protein